MSQLRTLCRHYQMCSTSHPIKTSHWGLNISKEARRGNFAFGDGVWTTGNKGGSGDFADRLHCIWLESEYNGFYKNQNSLNSKGGSNSGMAVPYFNKVGERRRADDHNARLRALII